MLTKQELQSIFNLSEYEANQPSLSYRISNANKVIKIYKNNLASLITLRIKAENKDKWLPDIFIAPSQKIVEKMEKRRYFLKKRLKLLKERDAAIKTNSPLPKDTYTEIDIERIKEDIQADQVFGYSPMKRSQGREWYICPFHKDSNPSLLWNVDKKYYHCFVCDASGDIITLYMKIHNCNFIDAIKGLNQ